MKTKLLCAFLLMAVMTFTASVSFSSNKTWPPGKDVPKTEQIVTNYIFQVPAPASVSPGTVFMPVYTIEAKALVIQNDNDYTIFYCHAEGFGCSGEPISYIVPEVHNRSGVMTESTSVNDTDKMYNLMFGT